MGTIVFVVLVGWLCSGLDGYAVPRYKKSWLRRGGEVISTLLEAVENSNSVGPQEVAQDLGLTAKMDWNSIGSFFETEEHMASYFLQEELGLSTEAMESIILNQSWILYLDVERNLRPTVRTLERYGFSFEGVKLMVSRVPSVLAINHEHTLPAKLGALEEEFGLSSYELVKLVVEQPILLTSSTERNREVAEFFTDVVGMSTQDVGQLFSANPKAASAGVAVVGGCWAILTEVYGFSRATARALVMKNPFALSKRALNDHSERVLLFTDLGYPPPYGELQKLLVRAPNLLHMDVRYFLKRNVELLRKELRLSDEGMYKLCSTYPQLLCYNPRTLNVSLKRYLGVFTGMDLGKADLMDEEELAAMSKALISDEHGATMGESASLGSTTDGAQGAVPTGAVLPNIPAPLVSDSFNTDSIDVQETSTLDAIVHIVNRPGTANACRAATRSALSAATLQRQLSHLDFDSSAAVAERIGVAVAAMRSGQALELSDAQARSVIQRAPWVLSYTPLRTSRVLGVLASSLVMSRAELSKATDTYPRLLSLSPEQDGKLCSVLRVLAAGAARVVAVEAAAGTDLANETNWRPKKATKGRGRTARNKSKGSGESSGGEYADGTQAGDGFTSMTISDAAGDGDDDGDAISAWVFDVVEGFKGLDARGRVAVGVARKSPVRRLVREMVVRYPLILGTSLNRIEARLTDFLKLVDMSAPIRSLKGVHTEVGRGLRWDAFLQVLRRSDAAHERWVDQAYVDVQAALRREKEARLKNRQAEKTRLKMEEAKKLEAEAAAEAKGKDE